MPTKKAPAKKAPAKKAPAKKAPTTKKIPAYKLQQKAAGYILAAANASK